MSAKAAAEALACNEDETEFFERLFIIDRMGREEAFMREVVDIYQRINKKQHHYAWYAFKILSRLAVIIII